MPTWLGRALLRRRDRKMPGRRCEGDPPFRGGLPRARSCPSSHRRPRRARGAGHVVFGWRAEIRSSHTDVAFRPPPPLLPTLRAAGLCSYSRRSFSNTPISTMGLTPRHKRQDLDPTGASIVSGTLTNSNLIFGSSAAAGPVTAPPLATSFTPTITNPGNAPPTSSSSPSPTAASAAMRGSTVAVSTVVAACVGSFAGLALVVCVFIWWSRHPSTKSRNLPRSPVAENRNARGRDDQQRTRSGMWNKLDEDRWEGMSEPTRQMSQAEVDEKNFSMFKKRTPSMRTTRTAKALEEHGFDLPPVEFSKYHPDLAKELSLEQPERPFTQRQDSGISWDGETVRDDSFLSLRSVRIESGAMSPTLGGVAKMTPPAMPSQLHRWESAEVLTVEHSPIQSEDNNPFDDSAEEKRKSRSNPFFNAGEVHRRRSRSNSRGAGSSSRTPSRRNSRATVRPRVVSQAESQIDPFSDLQETSEPPDVPRFVSHVHSASVASRESEPPLPSAHAIQSLIAALDLTPEQVQERLRVSMQPSISSQYSASIADSEIGIAREFPATPTSTSNYQQR